MRADMLAPFEPTGEHHLPMLPPGQRLFIMDPLERVLPPDIELSQALGFEVVTSQGGIDALSLLESSRFDAELYVANESCDDTLSLASISMELVPASQRPRALLLERADTWNRVIAARRGFDLVDDLSAGAMPVIQALARRLLSRGQCRGRLLIVDEDPLLRGFLAQSLRRLDLAATPVDQPLDFWRLLESEMPDLVLLGVELQDLSGLDLCRAMRASQRWRRTSVILLSSNPGLDMRIDAFNAGADDFIPKPVLPEELDARILPRILRGRS